VAALKLDSWRANLGPNAHIDAKDNKRGLTRASPGIFTGGKTEGRKTDSGVGFLVRGSKPPPTG